MLCSNCSWVEGVSILRVHIKSHHFPRYHNTPPLQGGDDREGLGSPSRIHWIASLGGDSKVCLVPWGSFHMFWLEFSSSELHIPNYHENLTQNKTNGHVLKSIICHPFVFPINGLFGRGRKFCPLWATSIAWRNGNRHISGP